MNIFEILNISSEDTKVHLAGNNGTADPLDLFFSGEFKVWQERQNKRNFGRKYILSLIKYSNDEQWLFGGVYESQGIQDSRDGHHYYKTTLTNVGQSLIGRLIVSYKRKGRNSYPNGESLVDSAFIHEIKSEPLAFSEFSKFKAVSLPRNHLELLFKNEYSSWKSALSSVSGVYLISDSKSGKLYVGSAYGDNGLWARWADYASNYHGNNKALKQLYSEFGEDAFNEFTYSILETCDLDTDKDVVIAIENLWKEKLLSREFGYNEN
ncbi:GIY-YIG nuclease family protein [Photobacterium sanguinicancri]|uniref:GIY-YIG nuclease family protein n=1 Tax=Photobacterium sanguinicancri TaxID=875932 RepID=A0AAW7YCX8_9GAMM|nr:GIY-YIG nuclease family protein [Photobacterium sanguinicancri]MDO6544683.1 GIY-YIG nuclease family protein [Photobacterium sanguinicancri]